MDYQRVTEAIACTIARSGEPLTETQKLVMAGAVIVYLDRAHDEGRNHQSLLEAQGRDKFLAELREKVPNA